jgi:hypothetical protein
MREDGMIAAEHEPGDTGSGWIIGAAQKGGCWVRHRVGADPQLD